MAGRPVRPSPPDPYGAYAAVDGWGGVASPLLAGFCVTLIALVVQVAPQLRWPDAVLVLLCVATVLFLQVVQLNARAKGYAVTPAQAAEWYDDLADPQRRRVLDWELAHHHSAWSHLVRRTRSRYNLGIVALLIGIAVMLVPSGAMGAGRMAAVAVVLAGAGIELIDLLAQRISGREGRAPRGLARWTRRVVGWVVPLYPPVPRPPFPGQSSSGTPS